MLDYIDAGGRTYVRLRRNVSGVFSRRELTRPNSCMTRSSCRRSSCPFRRNMYSWPLLPANTRPEHVPLAVTSCKHTHFRRNMYRWPLLPANTRTSGGTCTPGRYFLQTHARNMYRWPLLPANTRPEHVPLAVTSSKNTPGTCTHGRYFLQTHALKEEHLPLAVTSCKHTPFSSLSLGRLEKAIEFCSDGR